MHIQIDALKVTLFADKLNFKIILYSENPSNFDGFFSLPYDYPFTTIISCYPFYNLS